MFDVKKIENVITEAKRELWDYPKTFNALKEAGVEYYIAKISTHEIVYYGNGEQWIEPSPQDFRDLEVYKNFDSIAVGNAIKRHNEKETDFYQLLEEIAGCGVQSYRVDMNQRTVTYSGDQGQEYIEKILSF